MALWDKKDPVGREQALANTLKNEIGTTKTTVPFCTYLPDMTAGMVDLHTCSAGGNALWRSPTRQSHGTTSKTSRFLSHGLLDLGAVSSPVLSGLLARLPPPGMGLVALYLGYRVTVTMVLYSTFNTPPLPPGKKMPLYSTFFLSLG